MYGTHGRGCLLLSTNDCNVRDTRNRGVNEWDRERVLDHARVERGADAGGELAARTVASKQPAAIQRNIC